MNNVILIRDKIKDYQNKVTKVSGEKDLLISDNLKQWSINVNKLESTFANYKRYAKKMDDDTDHVIIEYRGLNANFRSAPTPKYWKDRDGNVLKKFETLSEDKMDPKLVFSDMALLFLDKNQIEDKTKEYNNSINEELANYVKEVNSYKEEVIKRIEETRGNFSVS